MKKQRVGIIHFLTKEEGGREQPPTVLEYRPTTHIAQLAQPNWSIVITFDEPMKEAQYSALCQVRFLFDHAPEYILLSIYWTNSRKWRSMKEQKL